MLDQVSEPAPTVNVTPTPTSVDVQDFVPGVDISSVVGPMGDPDSSQWLNSVDWNIGPRVDSY